ADSGHHSAIPGCDAGQDRLGTAPVTALPTPTIRISLPLGKGSGDVTCLSGRVAQPKMDGVLDLPPFLGVRDLHVSPRPSSVHARTPTRGSGAVARHHYHWTKDDI